MAYTRDDIKVKTYDFNKIKVGETQELNHTITQKDVDTFASLTGDYNPLHIDKEFASKTNFRKPVVHGMLTTSFISTMIGVLLPGKGSLWTSQNFEFLHPAFIGDSITVKAKIEQKSQATRLIILEIVIINQLGQKLVTGKASVKLLKFEKEKEEMNETKKKQTILITGASRGIGAAIAKKLTEEGHSVIVNYAKSEKEAHDLVSEISDIEGKAICLKANIAEYDEVKEMFERGAAEFGSIDSVIHCAAPTAIPKLFQDTNWEDIQNQYNIQVKGAYNCAKLALPKMVENKFGNFIIIGSIFSDGMPPVQQSSYIMAKAALSSFARTLAVEYGPKGVRVNTISPGMTQTEMIASLPEKIKLMTQMQTPLRKLAKPEDIAKTASFLVSSNSTHITGETIRVCGGLVML